MSAPDAVMKILGFPVACAHFTLKRKLPVPCGPDIEVTTKNRLWTLLGANLEREKLARWFGIGGPMIPIQAAPRRQITILRLSHLRPRKATPHPCAANRLYIYPDAVCRRLFCSHMRMDNRKIT